VYICKNSIIERKARLGPYAAVGQNSIIGNGSAVSGSVVFPGSYIGENLDIVDSLVDRNTLVNARIGAEISLSEDFMLGSLSPKETRAPGRASQAAALLTLPLWLPLLIVVLAWGKMNSRYSRKIAAVQLPASSDNWQTFTFADYRGSETGKSPAGRTVCWPDFFWCFLPNLPAVLRGRLSLVGVRPRTKVEIQNLSPDWQALYIKGKVGIITEAQVNYGFNPTRDELYSAETYYTVKASVWYDLKIAARYVGQLFGIIPRP
jgi:hypothetical protein